MKPQIMSWNIRNIDSGVKGISPLIDMRQSIARLEELPVLPEIAHRLMKLMGDPPGRCKKIGRDCHAGSVIDQSSDPLG